VHQFGGARPRARPRNPGQEEPANIRSTIIGVLPLIILVVVPLLSSIFSGITSATPSAPSMAFDVPHPPLYTMERTMPNFKVKYYLNPADVESYNPSKLSTLDKRAEVLLVQELRIKCENEMAHKQQLQNAAQGWFFPDPAKMELANHYDMEACRRLRSLGL
jgi:DnaJ family protein B protein 12